MKRKVYDEDFKKAAVARVGKESVPAIAADLKISDSMLYTWRAKAAGKRKYGKKKRIKNVAHFRKLVHKAEGKRAGVHDALVYLRKARLVVDVELKLALSELALGALEGKL